MTPDGRWTTFALGCSPTRRSRGRASVSCSAARARGDGAPCMQVLTTAPSPLPTGQLLRGTGPWRWGALARLYLFGRGLAYVPGTAPPHPPGALSRRALVSISMTPDDLPPSGTCPARRPRSSAPLEHGKPPASSRRPSPSVGRRTRCSSRARARALDLERTPACICSPRRPIPSPHRYSLHFESASAPWTFSALLDGTRLPAKGQLLDVRLQTDRRDCL